MTMAEDILDDFSNMSTTTLASSTTISTEAPATFPVYWGYICAVIAVILYGSNFIPVKKYYTGDGMFFQFVLCNGIFLVGFVIQFVQNSKFFPLVMVGGAIWATGNLCVVPIIKTIGMGLGLSIWGTVALLTGWASGRFGWFHTTKDSITHEGMNYAGVCLAACSILLYVLVKDEISSAKPRNVDIEVEADGSVRDSPSQQNGLEGMELQNINEDDTFDDNVSLLVTYGSINQSQTNAVVNSSQFGDSTEVLVFNKSTVQNSTENGGDGEPHSALHDDRMFFEDYPPATKKLTGIVLCIFSGFCYGVNFQPSNYVQDNWAHKGATKNGLDYVFAQFCGIYLTSAVYFYLYCAFKKNKPKVYPQVILPGIVSGILWAIATSCWFVANAELSQSVSFPIISTGPSAVASLFWGLFVFGEVKGTRNIIILVAGFIVMTAGALTAGFSR